MLTLDKQREESVLKCRQKSRTSHNKKNVINSDDIRSNEDDDDDSILF
jgi:hypothetical protein